MKREDFPAPNEGFVVTHYLTVADIQRSVKFYSEVLGGETLMESGLGIVKLAIYRS